MSRHKKTDAKLIEEAKTELRTVEFVREQEAEHRAVFDAALEHVLPVDPMNLLRIERDTRRELDEQSRRVEREVFGGVKKRYLANEMTDIASTHKYLATTMRCSCGWEAQSKAAFGSPESLREIIAHIQLDIVEKLNLA